VHIRGWKEDTKIVIYCLYLELISTISVLNPHFQIVSFVSRFMVGFKRKSSCSLFYAIPWNSGYCRHSLFPSVSRHCFIVFILIVLFIICVIFLVIVTLMYFEYYFHLIWLITFKLYSYTVYIVADAVIINEWFSHESYINSWLSVHLLSMNAA